MEEDHVNSRLEINETTLVPKIKTQEAPLPPKYGPHENRRVLQNVGTLTVAFILLFTAFKGISNLQSSLYREGGLGNWAQAVLFVSLIISALFVPTAFFRVVSIKWAMFICMFGYATFMLSQFYPHFATLIPAAAILGFCAAPFWAGQCTYLTQIAREYAGMTSQDTDATISKFFGIFFMGFHTNNIFGNLISSTVLSSTPQTHPVNANSSLKIIRQCGANFCPGAATSSGNTGERDMNKIYLLAGIYMGISLLAIAILACFLDPLKRYGETKREGSTKKLLVATFKQMRNPYQMLMIPLTMWAGLQAGFLTATFCNAFITCAWGIEHVGYVLICFGAVDSICSMGYSYLVKWLGQMAVFFVGAALSVGLICVLLTWEPNSKDTFYFFIVAAFLGMGDSFWQCGINAYYGVLFRDSMEAAFSNFRVAEAIGYVIAFVIANFVCVFIKLYVMLGMLTIGMTGFSIVQVCEWKRLKNNAKN